MEQKTRTNIGKIFFKTLSSSEGFLLVEVALALMIIGLLVGGVLKGKDLLDNSRLHATIRNLESYKTAAYLFQSQYGALPGDLEDLTQGAQEATTGQLDGDPFTKGSKAYRFWTQLSKSGFLSGTQDGPPPEKLGGFVAVTHNPSNLSGNYFVWQHKNGAGCLTPLQAKAVADKLGNGSPQSANLYVTEGKGASAGACIQDARFNLKESKTTCIVYYAL